jgi:hypothetical protein
VVIHDDGPAARTTLPRCIPTSSGLLTTAFLAFGFGCSEDEIRWPLSSVKREFMVNVANVPL